MPKTRYDWNPRFRRGQIFKTPAGSEIALERIHTHPTDPEYVDSVEFKVKSIAPEDVRGRYAFFYERPEVGEKIKVYNQDLGLIRWPRVRYEPTINASSRVAAKYKNKKQVDKADGSGKTTVYEYSKGQVDHRNREKAKRIEKLKGQIGKLRSQLKSDLKSVDPKTKLTALAVCIMDETCERVGNEESVKERGHFGVTTLQAKHVKINGSTATLTYKGKSGVDHKKTISDAATVKALKDSLKDKSGSDTILCEGDDCTVRAEDVNDYLKKYDITAKDIRGFRANDEMVRQLEKHRKGKLPEDKKEREDKLKEEFDKALEATAEVVGHEPSTLKSQYLVPKLEDQYKGDGTVMKKWDKKASNVSNTLAGLTTNIKMVEKPTHTPTFEKKSFLEFTVTPAEMDLEADLALFDELVDEMRAEGWVRLSHLNTQESPTYRVASRWITAGEQAFADFEKAIADLQRMEKDNFITLSKGGRVNLRELNLAWLSLVQNGKKVCDRLMEERVVPKKLNKGFEMAYRLFSTARKMPSFTRRRGLDYIKFMAWWKKTEKRCELVVRGWKEWDEKSAGGEALFQLGSFTVHNVLGASGDELEGFKTALAKAERLIKSNANIAPGFSKVLYGEVFFVPQLQQARTIAWYSPSKDKVYVRKNRAQWGADEVHSIIHELGHRYWKGADRQRKQIWNAHHRRVGMQRVEIPDHEIGDTLPIRFRGAKRGWRPTVSRVDGSNYYYYGPDGEREHSHSKRKINQLRGRNNAEFSAYPTPYSQTSAEEHFCEAIAHNCMGNLSAGHQQRFEDIWGGSKLTSMSHPELAQYFSNSKVASRWLKS